MLVQGNTQSSNHDHGSVLGAGSESGPRETDAAFTGAVPRCYDRDLGPLLFEFSGADLARRTADSLGPRGRVLEIACGTGIATAHLRRVLPDEASIVATDLNAAMLDEARERRGGLQRVVYEEADAQALRFADGSFDAVACQFGLMFFPDKARALSEMARVLRPGGRLVLNVWDRFEANPVVRIASETIATFFDEDPPRFLEVPFGFYATKPIQLLLDEAGFSDVSVDRVKARVEYPVESAARGLVEGTPGVRDIRERASVAPEVVTAAVAARLAEFFGTSTPSFELQEIVFTARRAWRT